jgi:MFS family permease
MPDRARSANPFRVLAVHRNFRRFWTGQTISLMGTWMQQVGQGWLALELTNDAFMVGLVAAAANFPVLLLSLPAGVLADRVPKLRLVTLAQSFMLVEATTLFLLVWSGHITIVWLIVLAAIHGTLAAIEIPSRQALIADLVGKEDLLDAIALNSSGFNLARIVGPSLAALAIAQYGLAACFGLNALSYLAVLAGLLRISLPAREVVKVATRPIEGILEGLRYIRATPEILSLVRIAAVFSICGIPYMTLMPVFARDALGLGASGYGTLLTAVGVGALVGALSLASSARGIRPGRVLRYSSQSFGALLVILSLIRIPWLAAVVLFGAGMAMILNNATTNGMLQTRSPDEFRGRVMSVYSFVFIGLSPIGSFVGGAVARWAGVEVAIAAGGAIMLLYANWAYRTRPELREL